MNNRTNYKFVSNYRDNSNLRNSLNHLTEKTYGFNFETWYNAGFWGEGYIPYSLCDGDKIIANVSVNLMDFDYNGTEKKYIQIGTVMTDKSYRNQGLSRFLINKIMEDWKDKTDGIYLFANNSVLEFYPKFGFVPSKEFQYYKEISQNGHELSAKRIDLTNDCNQNKFVSLVKNSISNGSFVMKNKLGLLMFYVTSFMKDCIYYIKEQDVYVIAEIDGQSLFIHDIIADHIIDLDSVFQAFGSDIKKVTLGFTPLCTDGYMQIDVNEEDTTLFVYGEDLNDFSAKRIMFPTLTHA